MRKDNCSPFQGVMTQEQFEVFIKMMFKILTDNGTEVREFDRSFDKLDKKNCVKRLNALRDLLQYFPEIENYLPEECWWNCDLHETTAFVESRKEEVARVPLEDFNEAIKELQRPIKYVNTVNS